MNKGGYKIVNFNGAALSGTPAIISGIYDQIVDDYDKAVLLSGVSLNGNIKDDAFANAQEKVAGDSSKYVEISAYGGVITVTEDDEVSFAAVDTPEDLAEKIGDLDDLETTDKDSVVDAINEVNGSLSDKAEIKSYTISSGTTDANGYYAISTSYIPASAKIIGVKCSDHKVIPYFTDSDTWALYFLATYGTTPIYVTSNAEHPFTNCTVYYVD